MKRIGISLLIVGLVSACGSERTNVGMVIPFQAAQITCNQRGDLGSMTAVLRIGGHMPCPLTLDTDLNAAGSCPEITVGIVRPLMVVYSLTSMDQTATTQVAYHVGWVDLRKDSLPTDLSAPLTINLQTDDISGAVITQEGEIDDLIGMADALGMSQELQDALGWASEQNELNDDSLDLDADDCDNLTEVCDRGLDGLFDAANPTGVCP